MCATRVQVSIVIIILWSTQQQTYRPLHNLPLWIPLWGCVHLHAVLPPLPLALPAAILPELARHLAGRGETGGTDDELHEGKETEESKHFSWCPLESGHRGLANGGTLFQPILNLTQCFSIDDSKKFSLQISLQQLCKWTNLRNYYNFLKLNLFFN